MLKQILLKSLIAFGLIVTSVTSALCAPSGAVSPFAEDSDPLAYTYNDADFTATVTGLASGIDKVSNLVIPDTKTHDGNTYKVTTIGNNAFSISRLTGIVFTGTLSIGKNVTSIGYSAFAGRSDFSGDLTIPNSVTEIGRDAFHDCSGFTGTLTISNSVTMIETGTFYGCSGFSGDLTIPNSITSIGSSAFSGCSGFCGDLTIPNSVTSIGSSAFSRCSGFCGDLTIPNSVKTIGFQAFYNCNGFTGSLSIGSSVETIGDYAFYNCSSLAGTLSIGSSVETIGVYAFYNCNGFSGALTIPNSTTTISNGAFYKCYGFTGTLSIGNSVMTIGNSAFRDCNGLSGTLTIPNSVTTIGNFAFSDCNSFSGTLTIGNRVTRIGNHAFFNCNGLSGALTIPESVITIGDMAFAYCKGFSEYLIIPNSVTAIGDEAFFYCNGITGTLILPESLNVIGNNAFYGCSALEDVRCMGREVPEIGLTVFPKDDIVIRVPSGCGNSYRAATHWSAYSNVYEFGDANWSKSLTVTDAVADANYIVGAAQTGTFDFACGDINFSNSITISDAISIIDAVAQYNPSGLAAAARRAPAMTGGRLVADNFTLGTGNTTMGVRLAADRAVVALQADFVAGDGVTIDDIALAPEIASTHTLTVARHNDSRIVRAIVFSAANDVIDCDGSLLTLSLSGDGKGDITAINVLASTADADEFALEAEGGYNIGTLGVNSIGAGGIRIIADRDAVTILNAEGLEAEIYDVAGKLVKTFTVESDCQSCSLSAGFYVIKVNDTITKIIL